MSTIYFVAIQQMSCKYIILKIEFFSQVIFESFSNFHLILFVIISYEINTMLYILNKLKKKKTLPLYIIF